MNVLNYQSNENGFTLMELMIVIAIISILSSVAIPAYQGYIQKAALTDVLQTLSPYRSAIELCRYENDPQHCHSDSTFMPQQFHSRYLSDINVQNGVISATGKSQLEGLTITMSLEKSVNKLLPKWRIQCSAKSLTLQKQCSEILKSY